MTAAVCRSPVSSASGHRDLTRCASARDRRDPDRACSVVPRRHRSPGPPPPGRQQRPPPGGRPQRAPLPPPGSRAAPTSARICWTGWPSCVLHVDRGLHLSPACRCPARRRRVRSPHGALPSSPSPPPPLLPLRPPHQEPPQQADQNLAAQRPSASRSVQLSHSIHRPQFRFPYDTRSPSLSPRRPTSTRAATLRSRCSASTCTTSPARGSRPRSTRSRSTRSGSRVGRRRRSCREPPQRRRLSR